MIRNSLVSGNGRRGETPQARARRADGDEGEAVNKANELTEQILRSLEAR